MQSNLPVRQRRPDAVYVSLLLLRGVLLLPVRRGALWSIQGRVLQRPAGTMAANFCGEGKLITTVDHIKVGDRYYIADVHPMDAYFTERLSMIGMRVTITSLDGIYDEFTDPEYRKNRKFFSFYAIDDEGKSVFTFLGIALSKEFVPLDLSQPKPKPKENHYEW